MTYYNIIVMVAVSKGGAKESEDKLSHTSPFDHNLTDIFALLRGGKYADMVTKHKQAKNFITCYAGEASCSFVKSKMTEITTPAHFSVADLSVFNYKALLFDVDLPEDAEKSAPTLPLYAQLMAGAQPKLPQKYVQHVVDLTDDDSAASVAGDEKHPKRLTSSHRAYNHIVDILQEAKAPGWKPSESQLEKNFMSVVGSALRGIDGHHGKFSHNAGVKAIPEIFRLESYEQTYLGRPECGHVWNCFGRDRPPR